MFVPFAAGIGLVTYAISRSEQQLLAEPRRRIEAALALVNAAYDAQQAALSKLTGGRFGHDADADASLSNSNNSHQIAPLLSADESAAQAIEQVEEELSLDAGFQAVAFSSIVTQPQLLFSPILPLELQYRCCRFLSMTDCILFMPRVSKCWSEVARLLASDRLIQRQQAISLNPETQFPQGITETLRGQIWQRLISADVLIAELCKEQPVYTPQSRISSLGRLQPTATTTLYRQLLASPVTAQDRDARESIAKDVGRTGIHTRSFLNEADAAQALTNVLTAYAVQDSLGYTQGMNFIAGFLLTKMPEESAFWFFQTLMSSPRFNLRNWMSDGMIGLQISKYQFDHFFRLTMPELHAHFVAQDVYSDFNTELLMTFCTYKGFPHTDAVWDIFLVDSYKAILRTALGLLHLNEAQLLTWEMEEIVIYLKQLPDSGLFTARNIKAASLHPRFACVRNVELARLERKWRAEHQAASAASDESSRLNSSHSSRHGSISSSSTVPAPQHSAVVQPLAQPAAAGPRRGGSPLPIAHAATRPR